MGDLAATHCVPLVRRFLLSRSRVTTALGGEGRVGAYNVPPYPRVVLTDPPGDDRDMTHLIAPLVQIEVWGDPDGSTGKPVLRDALYACLQEIKQLPNQQALGDFEYEDGDPVVTEVQSSGGGGWVPDPSGQPRYLATIRLFVHPRRTQPVIIT